MPVAPTPPTIGRLDPATGTISDFPTGTPAGSQITALTAGPDGGVWFTIWEAAGAVVARIDPSSHAVFTAAFEAGLEPTAVVAGPGSGLWVAAGDAGGGAVVVRLDLAAGAPLTTTPATTQYAIGPSSPQGLAAGPDGNLWITDAGGPGFGQYDYPVKARPPSLDRLALAGLPGA